MRPEFELTDLILDVMMYPFANSLPSNLFTKQLTSSTSPVHVFAGHVYENQVENDHRATRRL
jgi:hypothetical protein